MACAARTPFTPSHPLPSSPVFAAQLEQAAINCTLTTAVRLCLIHAAANVQCRSDRNTSAGPITLYAWPDMSEGYRAVIRFMIVAMACGPLLFDNILFNS
jgi:hypothetical protein